MMRRLVLSICTFASLVCSVAAQPVPPPKKESELFAAGHKPMTGADIVRTLTGNTVYALFLARAGGSQAGSVSKIYYRDEKSRIMVPMSGGNAGKKMETIWWMEGDHICGEQVDRRPTCNSMYRMEGSYLVCVKPAGDCIFVLRVVPGNPEGI